MLSERQAQKTLNKRLNKMIERANRIRRKRFGSVTPNTQTKKI